jgi:hypothetical protein
MVETKGQIPRGTEPDAELQRLRKRTTWTLVVAIIAAILSVVSIVISVAALFLLATPE